MKSSARARIGALLVITAAAGATLFTRSREGAQAAPDSPRPGAVKAEEIHAARIPQAPYRAAAARAQETERAPSDDSERAAESAPPAYEDDASALSDVLRDILDEDKGMAIFTYYYKHVLLDPESRRQYERLLSDPTMFAEIKGGLLDPEETKETLRGNVARMMKIDYLRAALEWEGNPSREDLLDVLEEILLEDNFPPEMTMDMRLSIATNKMELYALLHDNAPDRADGVVALSKGTRLEALIDFIAGSIALRRQNERSLESEVRP